MFVLTIAGRRRMLRPLVSSTGAYRRAVVRDVAWTVWVWVRARSYRPSECVSVGIVGLSLGASTSRRQTSLGRRACEPWPGGWAGQNGVSHSKSWELPIRLSECAGRIAPMRHVAKTGTFEVARARAAVRFAPLRCSACSGTGCAECHSPTRPRLPCARGLVRGIGPRGAGPRLPR